MNIFAKTVEILRQSSPMEKAEAALSLRENWSLMDAAQRDQLVTNTDPISVPDTPGRPNKPELVSPGDVPRRRLGSEQGRAALYHAVAHIELNAIDLAADMIARFSTNSNISKEERADFIEDWTRVCAEEAKHYKLLSERLKQIGYNYGDFLAHNGLWEAAHNTRKDIAARLAIAPMVLEARGLDVTPPMIEKLSRMGDQEGVDVLQVIYDDEIGHVKIGAKWFQKVALHQNQSPRPYFHTLINEYFAGKLKPPFNVQARTLAGLTEDYYLPLANC
ncbi:uncharacterized ferritin-like protein (DUF455 family) [Litorimonas taeanensis]|uniref:Uncharacterized ferritin-like protein (DUF455 family) n=1 Tax=Litorimonas taeanensis TaxID=568099 RepID=A0A420WJT2_9PROT|nr:ferritin-like domain-containing protein [Litorimonas taeanensis]RKQ71267.1 uncharacterized ferritin-like protein (DUF455 family) [Litorimonas taeanensis]